MLSKYKAYSHYHVYAKIMQRILLLTRRLLKRPNFRYSNLNKDLSHWHIIFFASDGDKRLEKKVKRTHKSYKLYFILSCRNFAFP